MNTALGGNLYFEFVEQFIRRSLALGLLCILPIAVASLVLRAGRTYTVSSTLAAVVLAGVVAGLASYGVIAGRQALLLSPSSPIPRGICGCRSHPAAGRPRCNSGSVSRLAGRAPAERRSG
jgi:hypothetical protein